MDGKESSHALSIEVFFKYEVIHDQVLHGDVYVLLYYCLIKSKVGLLHAICVLCNGICSTKPHRNLSTNLGFGFHVHP